MNLRPPRTRFTLDPSPATSDETVAKLAESISTPGVDAVAAALDRLRLKEGSGGGAEGSSAAQPMAGVQRVTRSQAAGLVGKLPDPEDDRAWETLCRQRWEDTTQIMARDPFARKWLNENPTWTWAQWYDRMDKIEERFLDPLRSHVSVQRLVAKTDPDAPPSQPFQRVVAIGCSSRCAIIAASCSASNPNATGPDSFHLWRLDVASPGVPIHTEWVRPGEEPPRDANLASYETERATQNRMAAVELGRVSPLWTIASATSLPGPPVAAAICGHTGLVALIAENQPDWVRFYDAHCPDPSVSFLGKVALPLASTLPDAMAVSSAYLAVAYNSALGRPKNPEEGERTPGKVKADARPLPPHVCVWTVPRRDARSVVHVRNVFVLTRPPPSEELPASREAPAELVDVVSMLSFHQDCHDELYCGSMTGALRRVTLSIESTEGTERAVASLHPNEVRLTPNGADRFAVACKTAEKLDETSSGRLFASLGRAAVEPPLVLSWRMVGEPDTMGYEPRVLAASANTFTLLSGFDRDARHKALQQGKQAALIAPDAGPTSALHECGNVAVLLKAENAALIVCDFARAMPAWQFAPSELAEAMAPALPCALYAGVRVWSERAVVLYPNGFVAIVEPNTDEYQAGLDRVRREEAQRLIEKRRERSAQQEGQKQQQQSSAAEDGPAPMQT